MIKTETLRALLIDRELGELAPDVEELLDAYIEVMPSARAEVDATVRTVNTTRETVHRFPELAEPSPTKTAVRLELFRFLFAPSLRYAAALVLVSGVTAWVSYRAGVSKPSAEQSARVTPATDRRYEGLWAKYEVGYDTHRGAFVVAQQD